MPPVVTEIPGEEGANGAETLFGATVARCPQVEEKHAHVHPRSASAPKEETARRSTPRCLSSKPCEAQRDELPTCEGSAGGFRADFFGSRSHGDKRQRDRSSRCRKTKRQWRILQVKRLPFKTEGEMKTFPDKETCSAETRKGPTTMRGVWTKALTPGMAQPRAEAEVSVEGSVNVLCLLPPHTCTQ